MSPQHINLLTRIRNHLNTGHSEEASALASEMNEAFPQINQQVTTSSQGTANTEEMQAFGSGAEDELTG